VVDKNYYQDYEHFLLYLGFYGSVCRKVYINPLTGRPVSRFIVPDDFIIHNDCSSVLESDRITHVLRLSKREILLNQQNGIYRDVELSTLKDDGESSDENEVNENPLNKNDNTTQEANSKKGLFPIYESHVYLNLEEYIDSNNKQEEYNKNIPLPYIITLDPNSKEILSIRRNWREDDPEQQKINYFIHYELSPGFGIYGNGFARLIGSSAITCTQVLNQLMDAAVFKNYPAGLKIKGLKQQNTNVIAQPGQFCEVDTGGFPLQEAFMPFPYSEPSQTLKELLLSQRDQIKELGATAELGMMESKEDIPTGTTLAMLEEHNRVSSAVLKSIHASLSHELQLLSNLFRQTIDNE